MMADAYGSALLEFGSAWGRRPLVFPFRSEPIRFFPRSWVIKALAILKYLAMSISTERATGRISMTGTITISDNGVG